jgi:hypothetical protein
MTHSGLYESSCSGAANAGRTVELELVPHQPGAVLGGVQVDFGEAVRLLAWGENAVLAVESRSRYEAGNGLRAADL